MTALVEEHAARQRRCRALIQEEAEHNTAVVATDQRRGRARIQEERGALAASLLGGDSCGEAARGPRRRSNGGGGGDDSAGGGARGAVAVVPHADPGEARALAASLEAAAAEAAHGPRRWLSP